jgi:diacylglycerol kinase family enzyme
LPGGTANVLAMEMKIDRRLNRALRQLPEWQPRRIPVGQVTCDGGRVTRHFLCMAGIGLDARIVYHVSAGLKAWTGKLAYWVAAWSVMGPLPQMQVELDGGKRRCSFALFSKVRNYGGDFQIAPSAKLFDDTFEAVLFEGRSAAPYLKYFVGVALNRLSGMKGVTVLRAEQARICCPEGSRIHVQIDGEFAGHLPAEVRIVRDALTLLVPREYGH